MIADLGRRVSELRFIGGVEKVEHVPYREGDEFWVRFNIPFDLSKLSEIAKKQSYVIMPFAGLPSKLPRGLRELLWDGVTHVIAKNIGGWSRFTSKLGFEPDGIAKLAVDLHGTYQIFMALNEDGIRLLYEYLGVKYTPPAPPPPKAAAPPSKPATPAVPKPSQPAQPAAPRPATQGPTPPLAQPVQAKPATQGVASSATSGSSPTQQATKEEEKKETTAESSA